MDLIRCAAFFEQVLLRNIIQAYSILVVNSRSPYLTTMQGLYILWGKPLSGLILQTGGLICSKFSLSKTIVD